MKKGLSLLLITTMLCSCMEMDLIPLERELTREKTIEVPHTPANKLYVKVNDWAVDFFNDSKRTVEFRDKEEGIIIGKYLLSLGKLYEGGSIEACVKFNFDIKDNQVKVKIAPSTDPHDYPMYLRMNENNLLCYYKYKQHLIENYFNNVDRAILSIEDFLK